jgi:hypothetical protein
MENIRRKMETSNLCHAPHLCHPAGATKPSAFGTWEHFSPCLFAQKMQSCQRANWDPASTTDFDFPFIKCSTLSCQLPLDTILSIYPTVMAIFQSISRPAPSGNSIIGVNFQSFFAIILTEVDRTSPISSLK